MTPNPLPPPPNGFRWLETGEFTRHGDQSADFDEYGDILTIQPVTPDWYVPKNRHYGYLRPLPFRYKLIKTKEYHPLIKFLGALSSPC